MQSSLEFASSMYMSAREHQAFPFDFAPVVRGARVTIGTHQEWLGIIWVRQPGVRDATVP